MKIKNWRRKNANRRHGKVFRCVFNRWGDCIDDGVLAMGYRTPNEESHVCIYCDIIVNSGQGILLKYSPAQTDEAVIISRFTDRVGHEKCIELYGSTQEQEALIPFQ